MTVRGVTCDAYLVRVRSVMVSTGLDTPGTWCLESPGDSNSIDIIGEILELHNVREIMTGRQ